MDRRDELEDRQLERQSRRMARPSLRFFVIGLAFAVLGVVLIIFGSSWVWALGIVLVVLAGPPAVVAFALLAAAAVSRWAARERPFA